MNIQIGDVITIPQKEKDCLGECYDFKVGVPYTVEEVSGSCITKLSGHNCALSMQRDFTFYKQLLTYEIY